MYFILITHLDSDLATCEVFNSTGGWYYSIGQYKMPLTLFSYFHEILSIPKSPAEILSSVEKLFLTIFISPPPNRINYSRLHQGMNLGYFPIYPLFTLYYI